jgi:hypothetical protein
MGKTKDLGHLAHIVGYDGSNNIIVPAGLTMHTNQIVASQSYVTTQLSSYALTSALGSYVPTSRTITINGTAYDLTANREWTISASDATKMPLSGGEFTGLVTFNFTNTNTVEWPRLRFGPASTGWDEGIIKASTAEGVFSRYGVGVHFDSARAFGIYSSGWTKVMGFKSDEIRAYVNLTVNGNAVVHAGNIGSQSVSYASTAGSISGYNNPATAATANTIAYRDGSGDLTVRELVLNVGVQDFTPSSLVAIYPTTNQAVKVTAGGARNFLDVPTRGGGNASGTWGISISGNAASATSAGTANRAYYSLDGFYNSGAHGSSIIENYLPAANNGAGSGVVALRMWCSEPGVTWDWAGFGYNVANNGGSPSGFGRYNTNFGQAYMRFASSGDWYFYNTNTSGTRVTSMSFSSSGNASFGGKISSGSIWINNGSDSGSYNENIRLFNAPNGVSVIAFSASGESGTPTTSILGYSDRMEFRYSNSAQFRIYNGYTWSSGSFYTDSSLYASGVIEAGPNSGGDKGVGILYSSGEYGRIRFYQSGRDNHSTIHSFGSGWQGGNVNTSGGAINVDGQYGVTLGAWNAPTMIVAKSGPVTINTNLATTGETYTGSQFKCGSGSDNPYLNNPYGADHWRAAGSAWFTYGPVGSTNFFSTSRRAVKTQIQNFDRSAVELIESVNVVEYRYKNDLNNKRIGFIAEDTIQEIATVNHDQMDINSSIGLLLKAVQELSLQNKSLRNELNELKNI